MDIELADVPKSEFEGVFTAIKQGIYPYVESLFGWDDEFQRERLSRVYQPQWFSWILQGGERVGLLCCKPYDNALHVHLLIIFPSIRVGSWARPSWSGCISRQSVRGKAG